MSPSTDKSAKNYAMAWRVFSAMNDIYVNSNAKFHQENN